MRFLKPLILACTAATLFLISEPTRVAAQNVARDHYWRNYWRWYDRSYRPYYNRYYQNQYRYGWSPDHYWYGYQDPYGGRYYYPQGYNSVQVGPFGFTWQ